MRCRKLEYVVTAARMCGKKDRERQRNKIIDTFREASAHK